MKNAMEYIGKYKFLWIGLTLIFLLLFGVYCYFRPKLSTAENQTASDYIGFGGLVISILATIFSFRVWILSENYSEENKRVSTKIREIVGDISSFQVRRIFGIEAILNEVVRMNEQCENIAKDKSYTACIMTDTICIGQLHKNNHGLMYRNQGLDIKIDAAQKALFSIIENSKNADVLTLKNSSKRGMKSPLIKYYFEDVIRSFDPPPLEAQIEQYRETFSKIHDVAVATITNMPNVKHQPLYILPFQVFIAESPLDSYFKALIVFVGTHNMMHIKDAMALKIRDPAIVSSIKEMCLNIRNFRIPIEKNEQDDSNI